MIQEQRVPLPSGTVEGVGGVGATGRAPLSTPVKLSLTAADTICFAMECAAVPLIKDVSVTNDSGDAIVGAQLAVTLLPALGAEQYFPLPLIARGQTVSLPVVDLRLDPGWLRAVVEREPSQLIVRVLSSAQELARFERRVDVLAFSEWPGLRSPPGLLASFVLPNEPCLAPLLRKVGERLLLNTQEAAILAYQAGSLGRARAEVTALYDCIKDWGVRYVGGAASFEEVGQKVRLVEGVLNDKLANCLDISLAVAGALEAMGFAPLVVLLDTHAFCGVWLEDDRFPEGVVEDSARLRTLAQLGSIVLFDAVAALSTRPFNEAQALAARHIAAEDRFVAALDIRVLRRARYLPLPIRRDRHGDAVAHFPPPPAALGGGADKPNGSGGAAQLVARPEAAPEGRFRKWKESLLDLTLRNRLLNFRLAGKSALRLNVPDAAKFEDILAADRSLQILPRPAESPVRNQQLLAARDVEAADVQRALHDDLAKALVYSCETEDELWERAIGLDRAARRDLEEGGAATLFAAVGLLRWFESTSNDEARIAPLLLYPVKLEFDRRSRRLKLRKQPDDPVANQTLIEKMRLEFQVDLSGLAELEPDDSGVDVPRMFRAVREAIQQMPRWEVLPEVHLGLFTFSKFLMWKDLNDNAQVLLQSPVVRRIADKRRDHEVTESPTLPLESLDDAVAPADLPCVLDLDGTQLGAVADALSGSSFVLQGPPGTGKSQTITALISAAIARGKTVLFVSEKMAALEVVHRRLHDVGVADFCLELHSHKTSKKEVIASFKAVLDRAGSKEPGQWEQASADLAACRGDLNGYARSLHQATPLGMSYYASLGRLRELDGRAAIDVQLPAIESTTGARFRSLHEGVEQFADAVRRAEPLADHPWRACRRLTLDATAEEALGNLLRQATGALEELDQASRQLATRLGRVPTGAWGELGVLTATASGLARGIREVDALWSSGPIAHAVHDASIWPSAVEHAQGYARSRAALELATTELAQRWHDSFSGLDLAGLLGIFEKHSTSLFRWFRLRAPRRALLSVARSSLPETPQIIRDLRAALDRPALQRDLAVHQAGIEQLLGDVWSAVQHSPQHLLDSLPRSERFRHAWSAVSRLPGFAHLHIADANSWRAALGHLENDILRLQRAQHAWHELELQLRAELQVAAEFWPSDKDPGAIAHVLGWLRYWTEQLPRLRPWCVFLNANARLRTLGLQAIADAHAGGVLAPELPSAFEAAFLRRWQVAQATQSPALRDFDGHGHHARVARFARLDAQHQIGARERVIQLLEQGLPRKGAALKGSELDVLLRECQKKARHIPIRRLLGATPSIRTKLKPCLLMSPLSVAQYLPAETTFDLVVFDEASQIETHDAIGALGRGRQVVIVGDSKQLPPTRFFSRSTNDDSPTDENDVEDLESILNEALAKGLPERSLGWHYRSRHDSLIRFSNERYYGDALQVFPAARRYVDDLGIAWHGLPPGGYQPGDGKDGRTNRPEAEAVVAYLIAALLKYTPAERTFGVVTFSLSQKAHIDKLLESARTAHPQLNQHFEGTEGVFVKNLENVQGDERDEILFSICYGKDASGKMRHHFGPLSLDGGERRLNVAVTRARKQLRVFSSMTHQDIDLRRTRARGAEDLRRFLEFASQHAEDAQRVAGAKPQFSSQIEREIHDELVRAGHAVHTKVGAASYQIDLAVVHPNDARVYALAVEVDGPTYRDAVVARDRDRLRGSVLRDMLWRTHRIWSPDWVANRQAEVARLLAAVAEAGSSIATPPKPALRPMLEPRPFETVPPPAATPNHAKDTPALITPSSAPAAPTYRGETSYQVANLPPVSTDGNDLYRASAPQEIRQLLRQLLEQEAPLHSELAFKRLVASYGMSKLGRRAQELLGGVVAAMVAEGRLHSDRNFLWRSRTQAASYRDFRRGGPDGRSRDAEHVAPEELANALGAVLAEALSAPEDEVLREAARALGIERIGSRVGPALQTGLELLVARGVCAREGERLRWIADHAVTRASLPPTAPQLRPSAPSPPTADPSPTIVAQLRRHPTVKTRLEAHGVNEATLSKALELLLKQLGRASAREFAAGLDAPEYRVRGLVASLAEVLNIDGYQILRLSAQGAVELDRALLVQAFGLK